LLAALVVNNIGALKSLRTFVPIKAAAGIHVI